MSKTVIIIGAGGHGEVIADIIISSGDTVVGFLDDGCEKGKNVLGIPVLGKTDEYANYQDCEFVIAIGSPAVRKKISEELPVKWYTAIHPRAVVSKLGVSIGEGTVIMANAVINPGATVGRHCIINTSTIVEHDNILKDFVHLSPKTALAGNVQVGENTHIGIGAQVIQGIKIASDVIIGAGAVVVKNIDEKGTYVGVPARRIK